MHSHSAPNASCKKSSRCVCCRWKSLTRMTEAENFYRKGLGKNSTGLCMVGRGSLFAVQVTPCIQAHSPTLHLQTIACLWKCNCWSHLLSGLSAASESWGLPLICIILQRQHLAGIYERPLRLAHCWSQPHVLDYCDWSKAKENNADGWAQAEWALLCHNQNSQTIALTCKPMK